MCELPQVAVPVVLVTGHNHLEPLPCAPALGRPFIRPEIIEPHEMTLGPPWFSTTEASLDLLLGLCVSTVPEIETECDRSKTAEDLEKEDHWGKRIIGKRV